MEVSRLMLLLYDYLFPAMWISYFVYWWAMATNVKAAERTESGPSRLVRTVSLLCAYALLWLPTVPLPLLNNRFLPRGVWCFWTGAAVTTTGLLFSIWGRRHLGTNWSQAVTVKQITNSLPLAPTPWLAIPSIPAFCWVFLAPPWPAANGAACSPSPWFSPHSGTN
jgi:hypothetical protein